MKLGIDHPDAFGSRPSPLRATGGLRRAPPDDAPAAEPAGAGRSRLADMVLFAVIAAVGFGGGLAILSPDSTLASIRSALPAVSAGCPIKGNVNIWTGERIYHVPGQLDYDATIIRPEHGERWFCSEADARMAGWRRAGR